MTPEQFVAFLGGFPDKAPLELRLLETRTFDGYTRRLIDYTTYGDTRVCAFLLVPERRERSSTLRGAVAIHQDGNRTTRSMGKSELVGLVGDADQHYAPELCRRGYIVLCPDRRGFESREGQRAEPPGLAGELYELHRAVDVLLTQPEVDRERIAVIGHSAGGWLATMLMFTDPRLRVAATSCATWLWRWALLSSERRPPGRIPEPFLPGLGTLVDQDDFLAGIAPRPYLQVRERWWPP